MIQLSVSCVVCGVRLSQHEKKKKEEHCKEETVKTLEGGFRMHGAKGGDFISEEKSGDLFNLPTRTS